MSHAPRSAFGRLVDVIEVLVLIAAMVFVVLLFANEGGPSYRAGNGAAPSAGAALFSANCARCHGSDGGGAVGPQLSGGAVTDDFPNAAREVKVVTNGRGAMPSFGDVLTPSQIAAVVAYTRSL
jgi:mono/diheme cytochrome c family protein